MNSYKWMPLALVGLIQACNISAPSSVATQSSSTSITKSATVSRSNEPTAAAQIAGRPNLPTFCDRAEYTTFFEKFVLGKDEQGNDLRSMYTANRIEVRDYNNPAQVLEVLRRQDDEFSINLVDNRWVQLVPSSVDNSPYTRLKLDIDRTSADTFRVNYIKAQYKYTGDITGTESEEIVQTYGNPGAYIFQHKNGCWMLTQKLQSTKNGTSAASPTDLNSLGLTENMPDSEARQRLIDQGWQPHTQGDPSNRREQVVRTLLERDYVEVKDCSGTGQAPCRFEFTNNNGELLVVSTIPQGNPSVERVVWRWFLEAKP
jgi:hypothetical protein